MHVLVIGGNRFVGRTLTWRLLARGDRVTLLNRGHLGDPFGERVERIVCDRTSPEFADRLAGRSFDAVVDLAAYTGEDGRRVPELLRGRVGHYVMISTGGVYLVREACPRPAREEDYDGPIVPAPGAAADREEWEYGMGKRACEDALAAAGRAGFPETRVRIPMVYGPLDHFRRIESYLWRLLDGGPVLLPDGGAQPVRHVDGGEVARFVAAILGRRETFGRAFNLAQEETPALAELLGALRDLLGSTAALVPVPSAALRAAHLEPEAISPFSTPWMSFLDATRSRQELGFHHQPLSTGLSAVVAHFLAHPPALKPAGYAHRADELALARRR